MILFSISDFGWQRVVARSAMMLACVFAAESIPHFGVIFDLVGGSTMTMCAIILPGIFNLYLSVAKKKAGGKINTDHRATLKEFVTNCQLAISCTDIYIAEY